MSLEEKNVDIIFNIESAIVEIYQDNPDLLDAYIETALDYLIRVYNAEAEGRNAPRKSIRGSASKVADQLQALCELFLGRAEAADLEGNPIQLDIPQKTATEMTTALKRIKSSVKVWSQKQGRQGYLNYVTEFIHDRING